jgi:hypothetical protein
MRSTDMKRSLAGPPQLNRVVLTTVGLPIELFFGPTFPWHRQTITLMGSLFDGWSESFSQDIVMDIVSELDPQHLGELAPIDGLLRSSRLGRRSD